jgi:hypothetical protein
MTTHRPWFAARDKIAGMSAGFCRKGVMSTAVHAHCVTVSCQKCKNVLTRRTEKAEQTAATSSAKLWSYVGKRSDALDEAKPWMGGGERERRGKVRWRESTTQKREDLNESRDLRLVCIALA